jgi:hypothetical protein
MSGYTKLFASILDSTIWSLSKESRLLWITMLVKKNRNQIVEASVPGLANAARLTLEETEESLRELSSPDKYSRTKEYEGRRIQEVSGGWLVLNGEKYRDMLSLEERREYKRKKQQEYRDKQAAKKRVRAQNDAREARFVKEDANGSRDEADAIAAEGTEISIDHS